MAGHKYRLGAVDRRALGDEVSITLRAAIISGTLAPGARLIEADLSDELGVSRGPIRDALRNLEADRLVVTSPRRGSTVAVFSRADVEEIYSLRAALEGVGARWLARRMSPEREATLWTLLDSMRAATNEQQVLMERDLEFHRTIAMLSDHRRVFEAWRHMQPQIEFLMHGPGDVYPDKDEMIAWHQRTVEALVARDAAAAEQTVRDHILDAAARVLSVWSDQHDERESPTPTT